MGETPIKKLNEIRLEYMLRVLVEVNWDYRRASVILKVPESSLRRQVGRPPRNRIRSK
jgi:hypothetical protein